MELKGKVAFVTGGASGIGLGIVKACLAEGMKVVIADLRQNAIDDAIAQLSGDVYGIKLDVTDREAYKAAADEAETKYGKIHVLVNNAGIGCANGPLWAVSAKDTDFALRINIVGILNGIQEVLPRMLKHGEGGYVVSTASKAGLIPVPGCGLYNLTKQATIGISETLSCDLPEGYGSAVLCPGPFGSNLGQSSQEVQAMLLGEEIPKRPEAPAHDSATPPPPPPGMENVDPAKLFRPADEAGKRVVRGIKNGDMYIITHNEFRAGTQKRFDAIIRAFPDEVPYDPFLKMFGFLADNPVFDKQKNVGTLDGYEAI
ncbi:MAG: SDR family NAD(P)-dependent oxidoreductase [Oscillospiraceae bacterium]|jgi:NAD(P)-dependent dehydrogenase (short-subunit alcohol dehydrogenase family)|nr:SDR family NAD(P)-dependent oxidoreductase [Oscillospiraceae bacterium]